MDENFAEFTPRKVKSETGELEVTGVSRSGRVRKKSSKLTDFESLDELDNRGKKKEKPSAADSPTLPTVPESRPLKKAKTREDTFSEPDEILPDLIASPKPEIFSEESEPDLNFAPNDESSIDSLGESDLDEIDVQDYEGDEPEGFQAIAGDNEFAQQQQQSLYLLEKSNKKKLVIKDGKIVRGAKKPSRKDKGQARHTAYMLWAKEIRQELLRTNPNLDFSQTSKKLGELWATVPFHEKYIWKRRASRVASKRSPVTPGTDSSSIQNKKMKSPPGRKFINKTGGSSSSPVTSPAHSLSSVASPIESSKATPKPLALDPVYKPVATTPLDVAAHLRLLGESLTIIGERLTESEGQIAVSGSFSLLLDSLLCALGPLVCLTQQVPQLNVIPQDQLSTLMDNIAYIMPGL